MEIIGFTDKAIYKQLLNPATAFDWGAPKQKGMCLKWVSDVLGQKIAGANFCRQALQLSKMKIHFPEALPKNLTVIYWWTKRDDVNRQHVAICYKELNGKEYWDDSNGQTVNTIEQIEKRAGLTPADRTGWTAGYKSKILDLVENR